MVLMDSKLLALVLLMEEEAAGGINLADIIPNWYINLNLENKTKATTSSAMC